MNKDEYVTVTIIVGMDGHHTLLYKRTDDRYRYVASAHKDDWRWERKKWTDNWVRTHDHPPKSLPVAGLLEDEDINHSWDKYFPARFRVTCIAKLTDEQCEKVLQELLEDLL